VDGDTIETRIGGRLVGIGVIGAQAARGNTPCGQLATNLLRNLIQTGTIHLEEDPDLVLDGLRRRLYYVLLPDGRSVARELVKAGLGKSNGKGREAQDLAGDEQDAKNGNRGCSNAFPDDKSKRKNDANPSSVSFVSRPGQGASGAAAPKARVAASGATASAKAASAAPRQISGLPSGFSAESIAQGFVEPTGFAFLPDGRILVAEKRGTVAVIKNGQVLANPFIDLQNRVNSYWDHGLLGITADPNFATNGYVYLLYTYENDPAAYTDTKTQQLLRVKAVGDVASTAPADQKPILGTNVGASCSLFPAGSDCIPAESPNHAIGSLRFGPDGSLFATMGDDTTYNVVDDDALRVQDRNVLTGKILRIDPSTGAGFTTNPFYGETGDVNANRSKVWAYGLRNPFRVGIRATDGIPIIGDVGWDTWEEVDIGNPGSNFGWPCYEGPARQPGYESRPGCQGLYSLGAGAVTSPLYTYNHNGNSACVIGGVIYTGIAYPQSFRGAYFFGDYAQGTM